MGDEYLHLNHDQISTCCGAPIYHDTDICSKCKEHTGFTDPLDDEAVEWADKVTEKLFTWRTGEIDWIRFWATRDRVKDELAELRYSLLLQEREIAELKNRLKITK